MHRTCPSMTLTYDSVQSKDAVTLRPKYNSLNQYSLNSMKERCGDLVSRTCLVGAKNATSHSARNSMTLFSSLGRASWTAWKADSMFGVCDAVGVPSVCLTYSSAKKRRHILETHWLALSMLIVILARGHGSGKVERQWINSDVSSGAITGSSLSFGLYWVVSAVVLPLLRCACTLAASYTACSWGPCWLTIARRYLHARMAALRVLGPSSGWFLAALASMSRASSSGDLVGSVPRGVCVVIATPYAGASLVFGRLDGMSNVGCTRHPSKK